MRIHVHVSLTQRAARADCNAERRRRPRLHYGQWSVLQWSVAGAPIVNGQCSGLHVPMFGVFRVPCSVLGRHPPLPGAECHGVTLSLRSQVSGLRSQVSGLRSQVSPPTLTSIVPCSGRLTVNVRSVAPFSMAATT